MTNTCKSTIQIKRGMGKDLPSLKDGELGFSKDTQELYIGQADGTNLKLFPSGTGEVPFRELIGSGFSSSTRGFTNKNPFLSINAANLRTNATNFDDYFCLSTNPKASSDSTVTILQSGFYSFHFDLSVSFSLSSLTKTIGIEAVGLTSIGQNATRYSYIPLTQKMSINQTDGFAYLEGGAIVYIDVNKSEFPKGVPIYLFMSGAPASEAPLAEVQGFGFSIIKLNDQLAEYQTAVLK